MIKLVTSLLLMMTFSLSVLAHNVLGGIYAVGTTIEGEAGFSNGVMASEGTLVEVFDSEGEVLGTSRVDSEGMFVFTASQRVDHHFVIDMSSGHLLKLVLVAAELPESLGQEPSSPMLASSTNPTVEPQNISNEQLSQLIETAVAKQIVPLRKELAAFKEKAGLQQLLGGIGYIFGLCGVGIWLRQRYRKTES